MAPLRLLIATNNPGKRQELVELLAGLPLQVVTPAELGLQLEVAETGTTYAANARLKAKEFAARSGLISLADDSGLEIAALKGWPGVYSSRVAGPNATDAERRALVLARLAGCSETERAARFVCHVAVAGPGGILAQARGVLEGKIAMAPAGCAGFGYDPIFIARGYDRTLAMLGQEEKNRISHRARAIRKLRPFLELVAKARAD